MHSILIRNMLMSFGSFLLLGIGIWAMFCFAELELINPFADKYGRFAIGGGILSAIICGIIFSAEEASNE